MAFQCAFANLSVESDKMRLNPPALAIPNISSKKVMIKWYGK
jgi:hypothetical protein